MEISFCSHPNNDIVIATIFGTWHDSWAVVACAKFCRDMITSNWITAKWNFHRIWIVMEKSLVKWVPASYFFGIVFKLNQCELNPGKCGVCTATIDKYGLHWNIHYININHTCFTTEFELYTIFPYGDIINDNRLYSDSLPYYALLILDPR